MSRTRIVERTVVVEIPMTNKFIPICRKTSSYRKYFELRSKRAQNTQEELEYQRAVKIIFCLEKNSGKIENMIHKENNLIFVFKFYNEHDLKNFKIKVDELTN